MGPGILRLGLSPALLFISSVSFAQEITFNPAMASPMTINPSFAGMFNGSVRASFVYRDQWSAAAVPSNSLGLSVDVPFRTGKGDGYWASGVHINRSLAGDGNFGQFSGLLSLARHNPFAIFSKQKNADLAIGLQAGYVQSSIDISSLFFSNSGRSFFDPLTARKFIFNGGISFSQAITPKISYTIGYAANALNEPFDSMQTKRSEVTGQGHHHKVCGGVSWQVTKRLQLRPAAISQLQQRSTRNIVGSELRYAIVQHKLLAWAGYWWRSDNVASYTAGVQARSVYVQLVYDVAGRTNSGFEIQLKYVCPAKQTSHTRIIPCEVF